MTSTPTRLPHPNDCAPTWLDRARWPWQPRFLDTGDGRQHYVEVGDGDAIVFVHGTPTWSYEWRHVIRALAPTHRCIAIDHLGMGLSDRPRGADYTPAAHAHRFARAVDALGLGRFALVVHDFGGPIALPFAVAHPERLSWLTVTNTWMWSLADDARMRRAARFAGGRFGRFLYRHLNASLRLVMPRAYGDRRKLDRATHAHYLAPFADKAARVDVLHAFARALLGASAHFGALWERRGALASVPTLVAWGLADSALRPAMLARWREALPSAEVVTFARAGHWPHEEAPADYAAALLRFARGHTAASATASPSSASASRSAAQ